MCKREGEDVCETEKQCVYLEERERIKRLPTRSALPLPFHLLHRPPSGHLTGIFSLSLCVCLESGEGWERA